MLNDKILRKRILSYAVVPSLAVCAAVLGSFALFQTSQIKALEQEKFALAEHVVSANAAGLAEPAQFETVAQALLNIKPLRSVALFDAEGQLLAQEGLPQTVTTTPDLKARDSRAHQWRRDDILYYQLPVVPIPNAPPQWWIVLEMDRAPFAVQQHRSLLLLLVIAGASLLGIFFFAYKLKRLVTKPLRELQSGVEEFLAGNTSNPLLITEDTCVQEIADAVGELVKKHQLEQDAMQSYLEEYTQELRETLETVEIQNIELDMARKAALQSSRAKSEFLANASHELRTPLNGIIGFSSLLSKTNLTNQQTDYLSTIEQSAQGLLTIINDILDISRLETGQLILEYKAVSIHQIIENVLKVHAPSAHEKKLRLVTMIDSHVPENLLGDPLRLKQVITNLVSNAVKFSEKGTIIIRVNFVGETDNQVQLKFSVSDNGIGLSLEQQNGLFENFSQTDTADNRLHGGTGLGLAIARGLVSRMHGEIGVESEPRQGSTFWFTARLGLNNREPARNRYNNSLNHTRVLIFDTDALGRAEVAHLLNTWGVDHREVDQLGRIEDVASRQTPESQFQLAILDAQVNEQLFDKQQLRRCIERLNSEYHIPVIVLALPNVCRMLEQDLEKLQAVALPRPLSHYQLHRTICSQLGISSSDVDAAPLRKTQRVRDIKPPLVLAVDDNGANLRLVSELLKGLGAQVETAESGADAIAKCAERSFDLILMDIQMPGMDGLETTRRLRENEGGGKRTPIVALTAHAVNEQKTRLLLAGMDDYLSKPVSDGELRHVIDRWTDSPTAPPLEPASIPSTPAPNETGLAVFDLTESLEKTKYNRSLASDMFTMLINSLPETLQAVEEAQRQDDLIALQEAIHKFHGGCCYCGVPALGEATRELHALLQKGHYQDVPEAVDVWLMQVAELQSWVEDKDIDALFAE